MPGIPFAFHISRCEVLTVAQQVGDVVMGTEECGRLLHGGTTLSCACCDGGLAFSVAAATGALHMRFKHLPCITDLQFLHGSSGEVLAKLQQRMDWGLQSGNRFGNERAALQFVAV